MTKEEIIKELETMRENLKTDLSIVNGKHDAIRDQLCCINSLLTRIMENENA